MNVRAANDAVALRRIAERVDAIGDAIKRVEFCESVLQRFDAAEPSGPTRGGYSVTIGSMTRDKAVAQLREAVRDLIAESAR